MIRRLPSISTTGQRRALEHAEVGDEVELAGRAELLEALVFAGLGEDIDRGGHITFRVRWR